ncbi:hypothetical protein EHQ42_09145 [Leptospira levettii]|uniref:hypothetical protein n=1 Tax=Leptospira levettii TaxID=2023178 RepID=UPI0010826A54|nr:hypothetical protein [Leptospira levettii]TGL17543.1 hypothetical protein EHQ42_09145 [Leptospira levettii]
MAQLEKNKEIVRRFNLEVIQNGNEDTFQELMHVDFINRTAPAQSNDAKGMWNTFQTLLMELKSV